MLIVDQAKCTKCGACGEVCSRGIVTQNKEIPRMTNPQLCNLCGQCVAVCPNKALDSTLTPLTAQAEAVRFPVLVPQTAHDFLRSRRSVRTFKNRPVEHETLRRLLDIGRFAPSGGNSQGLSYVMVESPETMQNVSKAVLSWMVENIAQGAEWALRYDPVVKNFCDTGKDVIMRGAPHLLIVTSARWASTARENACLALSYIELYATTLGLGSFWSGFVEKCAMAGYRPLLDVLQIPAERDVQGAICLGYTKYTYKRYPNRNPLDVTWL